MQKAIYGNIKNKNNILSDLLSKKKIYIRPAKKKLEDAELQRERREGDLLGLDLDSNLLLRCRRSRLL